MDRLSALLHYFQPSIKQVTHATLLAGQEVVIETASAADIYLISSGSAQLNIENNNEVEPLQLLGTRDVAWLPDGSKHTLIGGDDGVEYMHAVLEFGSVNLNPLLESLPEMIVLSATQDDGSELQPLIHLMINESRNPRCGNELVLNHLAEVLLVKLLRFLMQRMVFNHGLIGGLGDPRLARALTALHDQPGEPWSVQALAKQAGMSRTAFSAHFHKVLGYPPAEYLSLWRMRLAREWLGSTSQSIAQIADKLGYQNEAAFRRAFRKVVGHAPGWIRKQSAIPLAVNP
jgi:AraC-like DNA-binding protein